MIYNIPINETTDAFKQQVELNSTIFDLQFHWNPRDNHWFMDIGTDGTVLIAGIKLINSTDLLSQFVRLETLPIGKLQVVDLDGLDRDPDDTIFGNRVVLRYDDGLI